MRNAGALGDLGNARARIAFSDEIKVRVDHSKLVAVATRMSPISLFESKIEFEIKIAAGHARSLDMTVNMTQCTILG